MATIEERHLVGRDSLDAATALLQRIEADRPGAALYQAAELQWWWRERRSTDELPQLFWFDDDGRPTAAVIANDFGDGSSAVYAAVTLAPLVLPDAAPDWIAHVVDRGLAHAAACGLDTVEVEVDGAGGLVGDRLTGHGFERAGDGISLGWMRADDRPAVGPLPDGYRLHTRADTTGRPHHFGRRAGPHVEERLRGTSLYRPDLDLVVHDRDGEVAAYGLFWFDPATATGVVEPMRTEDAHQRRGLARHVLTAGIDRLAAAGAERITISWEPDNAAADHLYRSVGFEPVRTTHVLRGGTRRRPT